MVNGAAQVVRGNISSGVRMKNHWFFGLRFRKPPNFVINHGKGIGSTLVRGIMLEEDKAQHQSCHPELWIKKVKPGEWNKCNAELTPASPIGRKAVVASQALYLSKVNCTISGFWTARYPTSFTRARVGLFAWINSRHVWFGLFCTTSSGKRIEFVWWVL